MFVNNEFVFDIATNKGSEGTSEICLTSNERGADSDADLYVDNVYVGHKCIQKRRRIFVNYKQNINILDILSYIIHILSVK